MKTETMTKTEMMLNAGLNWQVEARPVYDREGRELTDYRAITRADNGHVFNIMSTRYEPFQNIALFDAIDQFLQTGAAKYTGAKSFKNGAFITGRVSIPDADFDVLPGDRVTSFLQFSTSHDGSASIRIEPLVYRMVCKNGMHRWTADALRTVSIRHTKRASENLVLNCEEILTAEISYFQAYANQLKALAAKEFDALRMESFFRALFETEDAEDLTAREVSRAREIERLIQSGTGQDIPGVKGSAWAVFNGVTEYVTHGKSGDALSKEYVEIYGSGRTLRERAFELLTSDKF